MKLAAALAALSLSGCAAFGPNVSVMSPDQLAQYAKDNKASGACNITIGAGWTSKTSFATSDEDKANGSTVTINPDNCGLSLTTTPVPRPVQIVGPSTRGYERMPDGSCALVQRRADGGIQGSTSVPTEKCP